MVEFNTAILYDTENLIGGYGKLNMLSSLSLKKIYAKIIKKKIGKIAIQRAYANWSDPRLNILKKEIIELGIDPIQMFGFGNGPQKNASDIQLAIDAIDISFTRKNIKTFIIVSGDGGFSSLAKKLHEYGHTVIGCAFQKKTNKVLEAVCDEFIWIEEPKKKNVVVKKPTKEPIIKSIKEPIKKPIIKQINTKPKFKNLFLKEYVKEFNPNNFKKDDILKEAVKILNFFASHKEIAIILKKKGLNVSIFHSTLKYRINNFNCSTLGFKKFLDFLKVVVKDSKLKLVHRPSSGYILVSKDVEPLKNIKKIHTIENYKILISKGNPIFKLPNIEVVYNIVSYLVENKEKYQDLYLLDVIDNTRIEFDYEEKSVKGTILSLISSECFKHEPINAKLSEQKFCFKPNSFEETIQLLKTNMHKKLEKLLGKVDENIFSEIIK